MILHAVEAGVYDVAEEVGGYDEVAFYNNLFFVCSERVPKRHEMTLA